MAKKPSMGRQKIKIEKIEVKNHLQVTFSKRRSGLFKKASELCTLCGVEIAIIVFSPAGKVFSFGHPNVESIVDRFLTRGPAHGPSGPGPFHLVEAHRNASVRELNLQLGQILNELEAERKRGEELDGMRKTGQSHYWWEGSIDKLGLDELEQLRDAMEELKRNVASQAARMAAGPTGPIYGPGGIFDQYESKPGQGVSRLGLGGPVGNGFGYCHGFF
ncbi:Agamous-like MADS-box protein AGL62 [Striga hermonthica]|uniref:Agamous-like MADS-box protein AGL62 n=1 Tax=Striga hermonthica TaxID=68872 RepID=A0A9N7NQH4_STRHE|nr:Agamous-like MADS-box protein AGL62 [Striga hermonthica]